MRINSISFKLISITLLITTTVLCGLGFYGYQETKTRLAESLENDTRLLVRRLNLNLPSALWNFDDAYIVSTLESEARAYFIRGIYVLNDSGELLNGIEQRKRELTPVEEIPENLDKSNATDLEYIDRDTEERNKVGKLLLEITDEKNRELLEEEVQKIIIQIAALNFILICLFAIAIGRMTKPLGELKTVAGSIADGNYDLEIAIKRKDEIGELAESFNRMKTGIKKKVQDLRDLNATGDALASSTTQSHALEKALNSLSIHSNVKYGSVYLYNNEKNLEIKSFFPPKELPSEAAARQFTEGEGIIGLSAKLSEIIFVPDTSKDERFINSFEGEAKSLICVPLMDGDQSLGVLNLSGQVGEVQFEESDYEYVETIARQLVTTVKNIRMRETIEEQNRTLEQKVEERTAELRRKNHDIQGMLHNMQQGLFTVMQGGLIHPEYSSYLESIFETPNIAEQNVFELLFKGSNLGSNELDQNKVAVDAIIGEDEMMFEFNEHLLAREYECTVKDNKKILSLDWNPIIVDGEVSKLMVTVRDVTELKALEFAAASQKRELDIVGQLIKIPTRKFLDFEKSARGFVADNKSKIQQSTEKDEDTLALLFRNMHTIKGNARTYGFVNLTDIVHDVESRYSELRNNQDAVWDAPALLEELALVEKGLNEYSHVFHELLGRGDAANEAGSSGLDETTINSIEQCLASVQARYPDLNTRELLEPVHLMVDNAKTCDLQSMLSDIIHSLPSIATELGKEQPEVQINADNVRFQNCACDLMTNVFSHLLRNSVDHGLETPEERTHVGKASRGTIEISTEVKGDHLEIRLKDDGKGINLTRLYNKGIENGIWTESDQPSAQEIAALMFHSGVSTKDSVSSISGRGVGMDAVKQFLLDKGGNIELKLLAERTEGSDFVPFETVLTLPEQVFIKTR